MFAGLHGSVGGRGGTSGGKNKLEDWVPAEVLQCAQAGQTSIGDECNAFWMICFNTAPSISRGVTMNPSMCPKSFVWNFTFQWYLAFIRRFCQVCSTSPCGSQGCGPGNSVCSANDYTWNERCARPTGSSRGRKQKNSWKFHRCPNATCRLPLRILWKHNGNLWR